MQFSATGAFSSGDEVIPTISNYYRREGLPRGTTAYLRVRARARIDGDETTSAWSGGVAGMTEGLPPPTDQRAHPLCESISVTSIAPIEVPDVGRGVCSSDYEISFSVTADPGDAMALDFLRPYRIIDWDVTVSEDGIRHNLKALWQPSLKWFQNRSNVREVRPFTILSCPEGQRGPVLACSDRSCETYESEESIPSYWHEPAWGIVSAPWPYSEIRTVREGESLEIPVPYEIRRPLTADKFIWAEVEASGASGVLHNAVRRDFDFEPPRQVVEQGTTGSGEVRFMLTVRPNHKAQDDFIFALRFVSPGNLGGCMIAVGAIRLRVTDWARR